MNSIPLQKKLQGLLKRMQFFCSFSPFLVFHGLWGYQGYKLSLCLWQEVNWTAEGWSNIWLGWDRQSIDVDFSRSCQSVESWECVKSDFDDQYSFFVKVYFANPFCFLKDACISFPWRLYIVLLLCRHKPNDVISYSSSLPLQLGLLKRMLSAESPSYHIPAASYSQKQNLIGTKISE